MFCMTEGGIEAKKRNSPENSDIHVAVVQLMK